MTDTQRSVAIDATKYVTAIVAVVTLVAHRHPEWSLVVFLAGHVPELTTILNTWLGDALGIAATLALWLMRAPAHLRGPFDDLRHRIALWWTSRSRA